MRKATEISVNSRKKRSSKNRKNRCSGPAQPQVHCNSVSLDLQSYKFLFFRCHNTSPDFPDFGDLSLPTSCQPLYHYYALCCPQYHTSCCCSHACGQCWLCCIQNVCPLWEFSPVFRLSTQFIPAGRKYTATSHCVPGLISVSNLRLWRWQEIDAYSNLSKVKTEDGGLWV